MKRVNMIKNQRVRNKIQAVIISAVNVAGNGRANDLKTDMNRTNRVGFPTRGMVEIL